MKTKPKPPEIIELDAQAVGEIQQRITARQLSERDYEIFAAILATYYWLRCNLCGTVFTAQVPEGVGAEKHDVTVASIIGLLKYGSGMPWNYRQTLAVVPAATSPAATATSGLLGTVP